MATLPNPTRVAVYLLIELGPKGSLGDIRNALTHEEIAPIVVASRAAIILTFRALARLRVVTYSRQNIQLARTKSSEGMRPIYSILMASLNDCRLPLGQSTAFMNWTDSEL